MPWDSSGAKKDKSTFIFSLNNKRKYTARNNNDSIYCGSSEGPRFGGGWPEIYLLSTLDKGESWDCSKCTFIDKRVLTNGEQFWDVKELEVYKIIFI